MSYNYDYPYDNPAQGNADWLIATVKNLAIEWAQVQQDWKTEQEAFKDFKNYVTNYLQNLDVQEEINNKLDSMVADGTLLDIMRDTIVSSTNAWLNEHITNPSSPPLDSSFTLENAAGQSKAIGEKAQLYRGAIGETEDHLLRHILDIGTYYLSALNTFTDAPPNIADNVMLENLYSLGGFTIQRIYDSNTFDNPYVRLTTYSSSRPWTRHNYYEYNGEVSSSINNKITDLNKYGTYYISKLSNFTDAPAELLESSIENVLLENIGSLGGYTIQRIYTATNYLSPYVRKFYVNNVDAWTKEDVYRYNGEVGETSSHLLSDLTKLGSYYISNLSSYTDAPSVLVENGVSNALLENIKSLGGFLIQRLTIATLFDENFTRYVYPNNISPWKSPNVFFMKKMVFVGDSFMEGGNLTETIQWGTYKGKKASYMNQFASNVNCILYDRAVGGRKIGGSGGFAEIAMESLPIDFDYIVIGLGINDVNFSTPLGQIDDATTETFYGAWNVLMNVVYTKSPTAHIGIIATNGLVNQYKEYNEAVVAIAKKWCAPCLNLAYGDNTPTFNRSGKSISDHSPIALNARNDAFRTSDIDTHPNQIAHNYETIVVTNWLYSI